MNILQNSMAKIKDVVYASKIFTDENEFYQSEEFAAIYSPYAPSEKERAIRIGKKMHFIKGFKVDVNPDTNYGRNFKLFKLYRTTEGLTVLKEVSAISALTNADMRVVEIYDDGFAYTDEYITKNTEGRQYAKDNHLTLVA